MEGREEGENTIRGNEEREEGSRRKRRKEGIRKETLMKGSKV